MVGIVVVLLLYNQNKEDEPRRSRGESGAGGG